MKAIVYDKTEYLDDNKTLLIDEQNLIHASTCLSPSALRLYFYLCIKEKKLSGDFGWSEIPKRLECQSHAILCGHCTTDRKEVFGI